MDAIAERIAALEARGSIADARADHLQDQVDELATRLAERGA